MKTQAAIAAYITASSLFICYSIFNYGFYKADIGFMKRETPISLADQSAGAAYLSTNSIRIQSWNVKNNGMAGSQQADQKTLSEQEAAKLYYANTKENPWSVRKDELAQEVLFYNPDIVNFQELTQQQVKDIADVLTEYAWVGVGRDDNKSAGEFEAVFYKKAEFNVSSWDTFWLSDTPFKPSKQSCALSFRAATVVNFVITSSGTPFTVINTHLDDKCEDARKLSASLIQHRAAYEYDNFKGPVILTGDFNSKSSGDSAGAYRITTGADKPVLIASDFSSKYKTNTTLLFKDFYTTVDGKARLGNYATSTQFTLSTKNFGRIDFQFGSHVDGATDPWSVQRYMVPHSFPDVKVYTSDHRTVISDITITRRS